MIRILFWLSVAVLLTIAATSYAGKFMIKHNYSSTTTTAPSGDVTFQGGAVTFQGGAVTW